MRHAGYRYEASVTMLSESGEREPHISEILIAKGMPVLYASLNEPIYRDLQKG
jgi:hypothetical protein